MPSDDPPFGACPVPIVDTQQILLGHGSGGKLSARLVEELLVPAFRNPMLQALDDQAILSIGGSGPRLAFTTDSYVVTPLFFPGGDIGELAVNGTVNDLAMGGAVPRFLSLAFILEEGLSLGLFKRVVDSIRRAAERAGVTIVTGDTKVVAHNTCISLTDPDGKSVSMFLPRWRSLTAEPEGGWDFVRPRTGDESGGSTSPI